MAENNISIFNDVLGPIITGPSSSNTAGALRITKMMRNLLPDFNKATIYVDDGPGAFGPAMQGLKSGVAFAAGLLDFEVDDPGIAQARELASKVGYTIGYEIRHFKDYGYVELAAAYLENKEGKSVYSVGASVGGGMAKILEINGIPVNIRGSSYEIIIYSRKEIPEPELDKIQELISEKTVIIDRVISRNENGMIVEFLTEERVQGKARESIGKISNDNMAEVYYFDAILTVSDKKTPVELPFQTPSELERYLAETRKNLFEAAVDYETARSSWRREDIMNYAEHLVKAMRTSAEEGLRCDYEMSGYSVPYSGRVQEEYKRHRLVPMGMADNAICYSMAVMELNSGMGRIVTCPTAGSSGIMPGILLSMIDNLNIDYKKAAEGLMVGGLIGSFVAFLANFDGSDGGCQAEVASGTAMGAAAACYLMGGNTKQILNAAVLSFEALMGLVCDPVAVFPEVPCILRNPMGASVAFTMANLALSDYDPLIPLEEIIIAMRDLGAEMPPHLRCQQSGCCATPTAKALCERMAREKQFSYDALQPETGR